MFEQEFIKAKQFIVKDDLNSIKMLVELGFNIDIKSQMEGYSIMEYFLIFSQNFERKNICKFLYENTNKEFSAKDLLFIGFMLLNKTIISKAIKKNNNNRGNNISISVPNRWESDITLECKNFWSKEILNFDLSVFYGIEILELAVRAKNIDLINSCIEYNNLSGISVNCLTNFRGDTLLHTAAGMGFTEGASLLIDAGAYIDVENQYQWTPLHFSVQYNHAETASLLINKQANLQLRTNGRLTALEIATKQNFLEIIEVFIRNDTVSKIRITE